MSESFVEGWSGGIEYQLLADSVAVNLTGFTVALQPVSGRTQAALTYAGTLALSSSTGGKVLFSPSSCDLKALDSPVQVRFKVTDAVGKITFFPSADPELWTVRPR